MSPLKAIREKCLACSNGQLSEVNHCAVHKCSLYIFRKGKAEKGQGRNVSDEVRNARAERMKKMWAEKREIMGREKADG